MVSNVPKDKTEVDVKAWIRGHLKDAQIKDINIAYDIKDIVAKIKKQEKYKKIMLNPKKYYK